MKINYVEGHRDTVLHVPYCWEEALTEYCAEGGGGAE